MGDLAEEIAGMRVIQAFASEDGASMFRFDIARAKAWGAVGMGASSRVLLHNVDGPRRLADVILERAGAARQ